MRDLVRKERKNNKRRGREVLLSRQGTRGQVRRVALKETRAEGRKEEKVAARATLFVARLLAFTVLSARGEGEERCPSSRLSAEIQYFAYRVSCGRGEASPFVSFLLFVTFLSLSLSFVSK